MAEYRTRQVLTDDDVRRILTSGEPEQTLAEALQVSVHAIRKYRARTYKRALRIAREAGLPPLPIRNRKPDFEQRAYVVRGRR